MKKRKLVIGQKAFVKMPIKIKSIDKENYTLTMIASTQDTDRHGDVVVQSGWILDQFNNNPVILNSHNHYDCTEVIANATRTEIKGKGKRSRLEQDWKFAVNENPKAKIIFDLYAGGFLHASSVGFIPRKFKENDDGTKDYWTIEEAELLEVSAVSVPANAYALAKSKGIDVDKIIEDDYEEPNTKKIEPPADEPAEDDEIPEDDEDEDDIEEGDSIDGDDSEEGEEDGDDGDEPIAGKSATVEDVPENDGKAEVKEKIIEPKKESYSMKVARVLEGINKKKNERLLKASKIISSLVGVDKSALNEETKEQIRKRKVNQAIRELMKSK